MEILLNNKVRKLFIKFCNLIQVTYVSYSTYSYLKEQNRENWRNFEDELMECRQAQDSIKTFNLHFSKDILQASTESSFLKECLISPIDITNELADEHLSLSGLYFLYCFAKLEYLGYELLKIKVPTTDKEEYNWHRCIYVKESKNKFDKFKKE